MRQIIYLFIFILLFSIPAFAQSAGQTLTTAEGYQLQVSLKPSKSTVMLGEPVYLKFEIRSPKLCYESRYFVENFSKSGNYVLKIVRDDGTAITPASVPVNATMQTPCQKNVSEYVQNRRVFLAPDKTFRKAGNYTVTIKQKIPPTVGFAKTTEPLFAELAAQITVVPFDDAKFGEVIDTLGKEMIEANHDSGTLFGLIHDKRTIKYYAQHLEKLSKDEKGDTDALIYQKFAALYALSDYNEADALDAIKSLMNWQNDRVRAAVAGSLFASPHPKALGFLIQMRSDETAKVRLTALLGLEKLETEESTAMLREMLDDADEKVSAKAQEILDKRVKK